VGAPALNHGYGHTADPAELDDNDSLPQALTPASPGTPTDPLQKAKELNVDTARTDVTNIS